LAKESILINTLLIAIFVFFFYSPRVSNFSEHKIYEPRPD